MMVLKQVGQGKKWVVQDRWGKGTVAGKVLDPGNNVKAFWSYFARLFSFGSIAVVARMLGRLTCRGPGPGGESPSLGYWQVSYGTGQSDIMAAYH